MIAAAYRKCQGSFVTEPAGGYRDPPAGAAHGHGIAGAVALLAVDQSGTAARRPRDGAGRVARRVSGGSPHPEAHGCVSLVPTPRR